MEIYNNEYKPSEDEFALMEQILYERRNTPVECTACIYYEECKITNPTFQYLNGGLFGCGKLKYRFDD